MSAGACRLHDNYTKYDWLILKLHDPLKPQLSIKATLGGGDRGNWPLWGGRGVITTQAIFRGCNIFVFKKRLWLHLSMLHIQKKQTPKRNRDQRRKVRFKFRNL